MLIMEYRLSLENKIVLVLALSFLGVLQGYQILLETGFSNLLRGGTPQLRAPPRIAESRRLTANLLWRWGAQRLTGKRRGRSWRRRQSAGVSGPLRRVYSGGQRRALLHAPPITRWKYSGELGAV